MNGKLGLVKKIVGKVGGRPALYLKKYSPEILVVTGVVGVVGSTILACKSTLKAQDILDEHHQSLDDIQKCTQMCSKDTYSDQDAVKDKAIVYSKTIGKMAKLYLPSIVLTTGSIACILGSHGIMKKRNVALAAAYKLVSDRFDEYRQKVVDDLGEDADDLYYNGVKKLGVKADKDGKPTNEIVRVADPNCISQYARFFDDSSREWQSVPEYNMLFLKSRQSYCNDLLHARGHLFLNEVYDALDIPRSKEGAVVGWVISDDGDNFVDFGLYNVENPKTRDFVNGYEGAILLDFNVDGIIYDLI